MTFKKTVMAMVILYAGAAQAMTGPVAWKTVFVPTLIEKFHSQNTDLARIESILSSEGGRIFFDHGATRTADPQVYDLLTRIANAFGLQQNQDYSFPDKHLTAVDFQLPGEDSFKWFSTLIKYREFSPAVQAIVKRDITANRPTLSRASTKILSSLEKTGQISQADADTLSREIVYTFFSRQGKPMRESDLKAVAAESPEAANALLLGPDFNHIAISLNQLQAPGWYGFEVIEVLEQRLQHEGFETLPKIQGDRGGILRQTSVVAAERSIPVLDSAGAEKEISYPATFVEFIQRGVKHTDSGRPVTYLGFLETNANKIYASTNPKETTFR
ncbi:MAG: 2-oxoadipate dioxygenase/decarboxylase family protein [Alphaproteobacteria bacterium]